MSRLGARAGRTTPMVPRPPVTAPVNYDDAVGDVALLEEDRQINEATAARPEPTFPAYMIVKAPGGYVLVEYALPTSVAEAHVVKHYAPDIRPLVIERLLRILEREHNL